MEIEAKFAVPSRGVYRRLARLRTVAGCTLVGAGVAQVTDRYFDTSDGRLLAAGYACRCRQQGDTVVATLKGLGQAVGAVHRRVEEEVRLEQWMPRPAAWPESGARALAMTIVGDCELQPLFGLTQERMRADLVDRERRVAELSLDAVEVTLTGLRKPARLQFHEFEVELAGEGQEADLPAIVAHLTTTFGLVPEPRSKFERGLAFFREHRATQTLALTPDERTALQVHATTSDSPFRPRAGAVLDWAAGLPIDEIASRSGLSTGRIHFWVRAFATKRLAILGAPAATGAPAAADARARKATPNTMIATRPHGAAALLTIKAFGEQHRLDRAHARASAENALLLFDTLQRTHKLPRKRRALVRAAAWLADIGATIDPERPGPAGRDLILAQPLAEVGTAERLALACIVAFSRGKARPDREPTLAGLSDKLRGHVMVMAALVRIAEALDASRTQTTAIESFIAPDGISCEIALSGQAAGLDAAQANSRADFWFQLFKQELVFTPAQPSTSALNPGVVSAETKPAPAHGSAAPSAPDRAAAELPLPGVEDPMSEAGRKLLRVHFERMQANAAGTRLGADAEPLHDMRVATRRMRAAFVLFAPYYAAEAIKPFEKGLRQTGRTLGAVRDLDVLLEKARAYAATLPAGQEALALLFGHWSAGRDVARRRMLDYLDSAAYRGFVADFGVFLTTPLSGALPLGADDPAPIQVRHVIPSLILKRYEAVRAYERLLPGAPLPIYHALRIECKGLRYALEFFRGALGDDGPALVGQVTAMQELLGELQDAHVAEGLLVDFLAEQRRRKHKRSSADALTGAEAYTQFQRDRQTELVAAFPTPWSDLVGLAFRRKLANVLAGI